MQILQVSIEASGIIDLNNINKNLPLFLIPASFADEELPLDEDGADILAETFNVLSLKEMKLQAMSSPAGGTAGEEPEDENMAKAVLQVAQKKVVSQVRERVGDSLSIQFNFDDMVMWLDCKYYQNRQ